jgi:preprotein translocase subunit SecA
MYGRDITYGTASEFGFDYLRDNGMATRKEDQVQRDHWYCIVDEIDSILVDEARTPLIISGPAPIEREQPFTRLKPPSSVWSPSSCASQPVRRRGRGDAQKPQRLRRRQADRRPQDAAGEGGASEEQEAAAPPGKPEWRKLLDKVETELNSDLQQGGALPPEGRALLRHRRAPAPGRPERIGRKRCGPTIRMPSCCPTSRRSSAISIATPRSARGAEERKLESPSSVMAMSPRRFTISQLLRAYSLYERDVEYVVQDGKVLIVDENTGRVMPGRRWSDGLHQAVEAKENVTIERETRTYATITIQNYFRMYEKLAGMTGTAETEATEFNDIYRLAVQVIPTNKPCIRVDRNDSIFKTRRDKYAAVVKEIEEANKRGQPVLVGTVSVESSEVLSAC